MANETPRVKLGNIVLTNPKQLQYMGGESQNIDNS